MPKAESELDRKNQTEIADAVIAANPARYDGYIWLSPYNYKLDGCLYQKQHWYQVPRLFFEAKQRDYTFGFYKSGYRVSVGKLMAACILRETTNLPSALFARFSDRVIAGAMLDSHDHRFLISGRTDRPNFPHDIEPCVSIPWDKFKIIDDPRDEV
jgi:hypothetical protein